MDSRPAKAQYPPMRLRPAPLALLSLFAVVASGGQFGSPRASAFVATQEWTGAGANGNWTNPANWGGVAPSAGQILVFPPGAARPSNNNDFAAGTSFDQIVFTGSGYTLGGNQVSLASGLSTTHSSGTDTINLAISGAGGVVVNGGGRLELSGNNSYSGDVKLMKGALRVKSATALGSSAGNTSVYGTAAAFGALEFDGSFSMSEEFDLDASDGNLLRVLNGSVTINSGIYVSDQGVGSAGFEVLLNAKLTINGNITFGDVSKHGAGTLAINGNLDGRITAWAGTLELKGNAKNVNLNGAVGYVKGAIGGVDVSGGDLTLTDAFGNIEASSQFAFTPSGKLIVDLLHPPAGGYPRVTSSHSPTLNGAQLLVHPTNVGSADGVFNIIRNNSGAAVVGTFLNLPEGATFVANGIGFRISYVGGDGNDVTLTVVGSENADLRLTPTAAPEPAAAGTNIIYSIPVSNFGPSTAQYLVLVAQVVSGTGFLGLTGNVGWTCTTPAPGATGEVKCKRDALGNGLASTLTLTVQVAAGRTANIVTPFSVTSSTPDPLLSNNAASVTTNIGTPPALPVRRVLSFVSRD